MTKKLILLIFLVILLAGSIVFWFSNGRKTVSLENPLNSGQEKAINPSETFIDYEDPVGFRFSYPDNLSLSKAEIGDTAVYTDLSLYSKDINGSLNLMISDTKFKSLNEWAKQIGSLPNEASKEAKLGSLSALEVKTSDRLYLGAIDQGILFQIDMPRVEQDFWQKVYSKVTTNFAFIAPDAATTQATGTTTPEVFFEGEEVIE